MGLIPDASVLITSFARALVARKKLAKSAFFVWRQLLLPRCDRGVRERSRNGGERPPNFVEADVVVFRGLPFVRFKTICHIMGTGRSA